MKKLYACLVLWLIRPALDLNSGQVSVVVKTDDRRFRVKQTCSATSSQ